jgi:adenylosuccinate synthase
MLRAIITVGLGFGDEGKGATVDFLARQFEADLVIRYCGGSQAGHNVQLPDGRRHTFSQFGAATLIEGAERPRTYLGPHVIIDPLALLREARHLAELGVARPMDLITIHPRCLVATVWHRMLNQLRELSRNADRHGSCGQGIGEARSYWLKYGDDAVFAADLNDLEVLRHKLELQRQRSLLDLQEFIARISSDRLRDFDLWDLTAEATATELYEAAQQGVVTSATVPECRTAIFEGAQGVLLDEYRGFHPHTTWSTVTAHHAWDLVAQMDVEAVAVLGITRAYSTRHGEGPFPTYSAELTRRLRDPGNPWNAWQGNLRSGWLDLPLLRYAAAATGPLDGIVVNHLDQITEGECFLCDAYSDVVLAPAAAPNLGWQSQLTEMLHKAKPILSATTADAIVHQLGEIAPVASIGWGPTHQERTLRGLRFRSRRVKACSRTQDDQEIASCPRRQSTAQQPRT